MILNKVDIILQYTYCFKSNITPSPPLHSTKLHFIPWKCTVLYILPRPLFAKTLHSRGLRLDNVETEKCFAVVVTGLQGVYINSSIAFHHQECWHAAVVLINYYLLSDILLRISWWTLDPVISLVKITSDGNTDKHCYWESMLGLFSYVAALMFKIFAINITLKCISKCG